MIYHDFMILENSWIEYVNTMQFSLITIIQTMIHIQFLSFVCVKGKPSFLTSNGYASIWSEYFIVE